MQYTTSALLVTMLRALPTRFHLLAALCLLTLAILAFPLEAIAGWVIWPPAVYAIPSTARQAHRCVSGPATGGPASRELIGRTWRVPYLRSLALAALWLASGRRGSLWIIAWPWAIWAWQGAGFLWPGLARQPEWKLIHQMGRLSERLIMWIYVSLTLGQGIANLRPLSLGALARGLPLKGMPLLCAGPCVIVRHEAGEEKYVAELEGRFSLSVADDDPFRLRLLILFLRLLDVPEEQRGSRRTRDGRTPFVRQQYLAKALGIPQPVLSRWEGYWQNADWRRLLSQMAKEVLTLELQQRIIEIWAHWPSWGIGQVHRFLAREGIAVTESQVRQAEDESGWKIVRRVLGRLCVQRAEELRLRKGWLVGDLLTQVHRLLEKVETGQGLAAEEHLDVKAWQATVEEAGLEARPPRLQSRGQAQPWLRRLEQVLFTPWSEREEEDVCCPDCGSGHVGRKGRQARLKKFVDEHGQMQHVEVYRYRCHNRACPRESFTVFPAGLVPYSPHRLEVHVLALQMYVWGHSTYRRTSKALGVASITAYRWVTAFGYQLLPVAALFGMVRSSGVVGVDEKWVQVPKNSKPAGDHRKWMYVYLAVDAHTYDLLHIAIYPHNTAQSAQAFLLALRAKGYHPRVVVTDLRRDYVTAIARVFPKAQHHECLFHAMQSLHRQLAGSYGWGTLRSDERLISLRQSLDGLLQTRTTLTAQRRYQQLMGQRATWVAEKPKLDAVFASLEAHWPRLVNGIESDLIPRTNNTAELVIRRFAQHYQNFCGFESLETAAQFLAVFEKVYRFTPFSPDAQPRIRGKSPLQLAGYDVLKLPIAAACNGWAITLPTRTPPQSVPSV